METINRIENPVAAVIETVEEQANSFILANTTGISQNDLEKKCIIPVYAKDNESTISHPEFIETLNRAVDLVFRGEKIIQPAVRVSHPIKGRIPEAMGKPVADLEEREKTLYYERMAFAIEIPSINEIVNDNYLSLVVGGVRAYNCENLYGRKSEERFKVFIGFKNRVCINLCIDTDGLKSDIRTRTKDELLKEAVNLIGHYSAQNQLSNMKAMSGYSLSQQQFAQLIGKAKMYQYLSAKQKNHIPRFHLQDSQISQVIQGYFRDKNFAKDDKNHINLWKLYNLFTGANKSSYIDSFLERSRGSYVFTVKMLNALSERKPFWYLN